ncbi:PREDICTED: cytoskeleton-associated protein 2-like, partial [Apaloderma vittatum]|uniref:cytoskeleton-associated protein 2-like n=1 Tax=Apaloderma vittatum TaxID=57397 RepID=UPI0005216101
RAEKTAPGLPSPQRKTKMVECEVDRNEKDVLGNVAKDAQRNGKLGAKSTQRAGLAAPQKSSNASQRAAVARPEQLRKNAKLPVGLVPSVSRLAQTAERLPASNSGHLNPERNKKPSQKTVATPAPGTGGDQPHPGAPCSQNEGLWDRLVGNKENVQAQASVRPVLNRAFQSRGNNLENRRVWAHQQSSATMSRTVPGTQDRASSRQAKEEPIQDKFRKTLPGSKSVPPKTNTKTQPLQPPRLLTASANLLYKNPGENQGKTNMARGPVGKPLGVPPAGNLKPYNRPLQMKIPPAKPPQAPPTLKPSLKPSGTVPWQRPSTKLGTDRRDVKVVPPGCTAASRPTVPPNQPRGTYGSRTQARASNFGCRRVPKTPSAADRKKQLEEWLASKGKTYKRPPMMLLQKKQIPLSRRNVKEKEKREKPEQQPLEMIDSILTECLKLAEEGVDAEELSAVLSHVPQAEKFAKFWICKVKLLARSGPFDVIGLYKDAVCAGAA